MPTLPIYQQRTSASSASAGSGATHDARAEGAGFHALGRAIARIEDRRERAKDEAERERQRVKDEDDNAWAAENLGKFEGKWERESRARKDSAPPSARGITETFLADYDKDARELLSRAPSPRVRQYLKEKAEINYREHLFTNMSAFEASKAADHSVEIINSTRDEKRKVVQSSPLMFDQMVAEMDEMVGSMRLPEEWRARERDGSREVLANDATIGWILANPHAAAKALRAKPGTSGIGFVEALSADDRLARANQAGAEINRRAAEQRANVAEARNGLQESRNDALAARAAGLPAELPSRSAYRAAYPQDGEQRYGLDSQLMSTYDAASAAVLLPPDEGRALIANYRPTEQEGAADQSQVQNHAQKLYEQHRKAFEADPAGTVVRRDTAIAELLQGASDGDQEAAAAYVAKVRAAQNAAGIADFKILPASAAEGLATALAFDPEKPGQRAQALEVMKLQWGRAFPQVIREIAPNLEGDARVMVGMRPEIAKQYDQALANSTKVRSLVPSPDVTIIKEKVNQSLEGLAGTMIYADDGQARLAEIQTAAQLLATSYAASGTSPAEAAERAAEVVVNERYQYRDTLRVPRSFDADEVEGGAASIKSGLLADGLAVAPMAGESPDAARRDLQHFIQREGYWVTTSDEAGAELHIPYQGGSVPVLRTDGSRVRYSWDELAARKGRRLPKYLEKGLPK